MFMVWQDHDARVVRRVLSGRHNDFGILVERYLPTAQAVARGNLYNPEDAEDVTQESFVSAFQKLDTLRAPQKFGPWFITIVRNTARSWSRRQRKETSLDAVPELMQSVAPPPIEKEEANRLLHQTLQGMDQERREILMLHYFAGRSLREIAELQGITREAAAKRLQRSREALGEEMLKVVHHGQPSKESTKHRAKAILAVVVASPVMWHAAPAYAGAAVAAGVVMKWVVGVAVVGAAAAATYVVVPGLFQNAQNTTVAEAAAPAPETPALAAASATPAAVEETSAEEVLPGVAENGSLPTGPCTLSTQLVDLQDRPVPNLDVAIELVNWGMTEFPPEKPARWTGRADAGGHFTFENLPEGPYCITAISGAMGGANDANLRVERGYSPRNVKMYPVMPCGGTVCDEAGAPIAGAVLYPVKHVLFPDEEFDHWTVASVRAQSDEKGHFEFKGLIPGGWILFVVAPGHEPTYTEPVQVPDTAAKVVIGQPGSMSGRVIDARDGETVPFVKLRFSQGDTLYLGEDAAGKAKTSERIRCEVKTDADGLFSIGALMPGDYRIFVDDPMLCLADQKQTAKVASAQATEQVEVRVSTGGLVSGRVYDKVSNAGVMGVQISVYSPEVRFSKEAFSGSDGAYAIGGLPAGNYRISMYTDVEGYISPSYGGMSERTVRVEVDKPQEGIDFSLEPGVTVSGIVVDKDGNPVEGAEVHANTLGSQSPGEYAHDSCKSEADGAFAMTRLRSGTEVRVIATKDDWQAEETNLRLAADGIKDLTIRLDVLAGSTIRGKVTDEGGKPMANAMVTARLMDAGQPEPVVEAEPDGSFVFEHMEAGRYALTAQPYDRGMYSTGIVMNDPNAEPPAEVIVDLGERETEKDVIVKCPGVGDLKISGRVLSPDGKPMPYAALTLAESPKIATVLLTGTFEFTGLRPGTYTVYAAAPGYSSVVQSGVEAGTTNVVIRLAKPATLLGRVIDVARNAPVTAFTVEYAATAQLMADTSPGINGEQRFEDANGEFRIEGMSTLPMTLKVRAEGYAPWESPLDGLNGGQENEVLVELEPGGVIAGYVHDAAGNPLGQVSISDFASQQHNYGQGSGIVTTADGRFEMRDVPAGEPLTLNATLSGYATTSVEVTPGTGVVTPVDIVMGAGGSVRVRVTRNGVPEKASYIRVDSPVSYGGSMNEGRFEENGDYIVEHLPAGEATVAVALQVEENQLNRHEKVTVAEGAETLVELDFGLGGGVIEGTVTMDGAPLPNVFVVVAATEGGESTARQTDADGYFRVDGLPAGEYRVHQAAEIGELSRRTNEVRVTLADQGSARMDWNIAGAGAIRVNLSGFAMGQVNALLVYEGNITVEELQAATEGQETPLSMVLHQQIQGDGEYVLERIPPDMYTVILTCYDAPAQPGTQPNIRYYSLGAAGVSGDETVDLTARP